MPIRALLSFALVWIAVATPCAAPDDATIVRVSPDGLRNAFVLPSADDRSQRAVVRWSDAESDGCRSVELSGIVRDITFVPAEAFLFALQHKPGKQGRGETHLTRIDMDTCRFKRELLMPESASGLTHWPRENALLAASRDEVRTVRLPALRSGPLFRIPGPNRKIVVLGNSRVLVGQAESVLLIDLSDPPTRESMPIRRTWNVPAPVVSIDTRHADHVRVVTEDGRVTEIRIPVDRVVQIAPPAPPTPKAPTPMPTAAPTPVPDVGNEPEPTVANHQVVGKIVGDAAGSVVGVVLSGPNNLLREAARVPVDDRGRWFIDDLAHGRYRIQLDGGGGRVIVSDPPFLILDVQGEAAIEAPSIRAVRIL